MAVSGANPTDRAVEFSLSTLVLWADSPVRENASGGIGPLVATRFLRGRICRRRHVRAQLGKISVQACQCIARRLLFIDRTQGIGKAEQGVLSMGSLAGTGLGVIEGNRGLGILLFTRQRLCQQKACIVSTWGRSI